MIIEISLRLVDVNKCWCAVVSIILETTFLGYRNCPVPKLEKAILEALIDAASCKHSSM